MPRRPSLTPRQARFVSHYLICLNATQAAIRAGYSERQGAVLGWQLLQKPQVKAAIAQGSARALARAELTKDEIVRTIAAQVRRDVRRLFTADGCHKPISELTAEDGQMIDAYEVVVANVAGGDGHQDTIHRVRLEPRWKYVEMAAKYFGLLTERVHVTGDWETLAARLASARALIVAVKVEK